MRYLVLLASDPGDDVELPDLDAAAAVAASLLRRDPHGEIRPVTRVEGYGPQ